MKQEDKQRYREIADALLSEQNFAAAMIAGGVATIVAAIAYGIVVNLWGFAYGFAAVGIGIIVGISMRYLGRGIETKFAVAAAIYTIAGCVLGQLAGIAMLLARDHATSPLDVVREDGFLALAKSSAAGLSVVELVFWCVAVFFAVFLVQRPLSRSERLAMGVHNQ